MSARQLDLNARRAARWEAAGEPPTVVIGDETFTLPVELPLAFLEALNALDVRRAVGTLVGDADVDRFLAQRPSIEDLMELRSLYGVDVGEASASTTFSANGGSPSRPTG